MTNVTDEEFDVLLKAILSDPDGDHDTLIGHLYAVMRNMHKNPFVRLKAITALKQESARGSLTRYVFMQLKRLAELDCVEAPGVH